MTEQSVQFLADKLGAAVVEAIAYEWIKDYWKRQGYSQVWVKYNPAFDPIGKRGFDLYDFLGFKWEIKSDRRWVFTGNFFLEHPLLESQADFFLFFAGTPIMLTKAQVVHLITCRQYPERMGGDGDRMRGTLVPVQVLRQMGN